MSIENTFKVDKDIEIVINDGWIRIWGSISTDIRYEGNFTLIRVSECLRNILKDREKLNGDWVSLNNFDLQIALEFDDTEELSKSRVNLCISTGAVYITLNMEASKLPDLIQYLYNNHTEEVVD